MTAPRTSSVCAEPACPHLTPCPVHARPANAHWSPDRDREAQRWFRAQVLARAGHRCEDCGATTELVAHHTRPGNDDPATGACLCADCHRRRDRHAR